MRSPFTADYRPPIEPPAQLDPDQAAYWAVVAEQWHPDDDVRDRILLGMLARTDQSSVIPAVRARLIDQAHLALAEHIPDEDGRCTGLHSDSQPRWPVPFPCWCITYARLVTPQPAGVTPAEDPDTDKE
ncbi:MAG: hypothetical protein ACRDT6_18895 [Micromonosporaceae bacterium]